MRLIVVDDQLSVLRKMKEVLTGELQGIEMKMVCCNKHGRPNGFPSGQEDWLFAASEDELYEVCSTRLEIQPDDFYLVDITLFEESQMDMFFTEYLSVMLADYLTQHDVDATRIKFYTRPEVLSIDDFERDTQKWQSPIYRPGFEITNHEEDAEEYFIKEVKEFCHV